jgi:hypothetical protein
MLDGLLDTGGRYLGVGLPVLGAALALWSFFGRSARRRCPQCGLRLKDNPTLICPRCDYDASYAYWLYQHRPRWWQTNPLHRPPHRWLMLVLAALLLLSPLGLSIAGWMREQAAVERLVGLKAVVRFNDGSRLGGPAPARTAAANKSRFRRAVSVDLSATGATDADLATLVPMTRLSVLKLRNTRLTDAGLAHVGRLNGLIELSLEGTAVTDAGLAPLQRLRHLESLSLAGTGVTDLGVGPLERLDRLRHLDLTDTKVSPALQAHWQELLKARIEADEAERQAELEAARAEQPLLNTDDPQRNELRQQQADLAVKVQSLPDGPEKAVAQQQLEAVNRQLEQN